MLFSLLDLTLILKNKMAEKKSMYLSKPQLEAELNRCLNCKNMPCMKTCPVHCNPQAFIAAAKEGNGELSAKLISDENPFGQTCGLICPDKFCMKACTRRLIDFPINITKVQATLMEKFRNFKYDYSNVVPNSKKIAIIGAGPSGIAAAYFLARNGFKCVIFEKSSQIGGALNLIPHERLPQDAILKDWEFVNNSDLISVVFESDISNPSELFSQGFDEVLIAGGEPNCAKLNIEGENLAVSYLDYLAKPEKYVTKGNVAVIGGGNVAADCAIVAQAQGAVYVEMFVRRGLSDMKITPAERHEILERKINVSAGTSPDKIIKTGEKYSLFVHKNRFNGEKWEPISDTSIELPDFDLIIRAIGAKADEKQDDPRLIYIGDCKTGGSTLVEAMADAKNTAFELIQKYQA